MYITLCLYVVCPRSVCVYNPVPCAVCCRSVAAPAAGSAGGLCSVAPSGAAVSPPGRHLASAAQPPAAPAAAAAGTVSGRSERAARHQLALAPGSRQVAADTAVTLSPRHGPIRSWSQSQTRSHQELVTVPDTVPSGAGHSPIRSGSQSQTRSHQERATVPDTVPSGAGHSSRHGPIRSWSQSQTRSHQERVTVPAPTTTVCYILILHFYCIVKF